MPLKKHNSWAPKLSPFLILPGYVYDPDGIDIELLKDVKEVRPRSYQAGLDTSAIYHEVSVHGVRRATLPCLAQHKMSWNTDIQKLVSGGTRFVVRGANIPHDLEATNYLVENGVLLRPRSCQRRRHFNIGP